MLRLLSQSLTTHNLAKVLFEDLSPKKPEKAENNRRIGL
jgi:hypothetical protein